MNSKSSWVNQLSEVLAERDELAVAVRVWQRMSEHLAAERATAGSPVVQVVDRAVRLVPDRVSGVAESALPADYQHILAAVRQAGRSPPGPSVRRWVWTPGCGASWSRCAGSSDRRPVRRKPHPAPTPQQPVRHCRRPSGALCHPMPTD
ncbi:hypothetical protein [Streptomyces sp. 4N124]|uniref:hypothetical protein n=1 Tax=Streptomyces sp. 4N124 TaxID=3457420 RepID=UPI003FCFCFAE